MKTFFHKIKRFLLISVICVIGYLAVANYYIYKVSKNYLQDTSSKLPNTKYGLILGTSKYFKKGKGNDFYDQRILAVVQLFADKKISKVIVSGTHEESSYSEPICNTKRFNKKGVPDSLIILDYFGDRTIHSINNFKKDYKSDSVIIISQKFHNQRAVYLARKQNIYAWGYNAGDVKLSTSYKVLFRELFAKAIAITE
ncbi:MAG: YdcF family protein [Bacteroidetes bacterium]|nr:YdcF family protein [Bacteroidota bacterium]